MFLLALGRPSDAELVRRFQAGDRRAFHEIVLRYQDRVFRLCVRWLGDAAVAEETAQDIFVALFRALPSFRGEAQLSTFVFRVAVNHNKNRRAYRRRRHDGEHEQVDAPATEDRPGRQIAAEQPEAADVVFRSQAERLVHQALDMLDEETRQILLLRDVEDLPYEEIAEILDLPRGTVKSRLHRARAQLAVVLGRQLAPEDVNG
jgi:RNA polymerase sigma-70 factor (ECF subfamily)